MDAVHPTHAFGFSFWVSLFMAPVAIHQNAWVFATMFALWTVMFYFVGERYTRSE